jgi:hypothetical protein
MKRLAILLAVLLPGCAVYPASPYYAAPYYRPAPPPVVAYGYGYRPYYGGGYYRGGWGRRW